ncbi:hypothetical protein F4801DRAFT_535863 [Xylaria longipes]|nr:hypothetical protein F4801DRAFT_535863 [Xylaria longipes]
MTFTSPSSPQICSLRPSFEPPTICEETGRCVLGRFRKPGWFRGYIEKTEHIPEDIKDLYRNIRSAKSGRRHIMPHEVRSRMKADVGDPDDDWFRNPGQEQATGVGPTTQEANALATYSSLCKIIDETVASSQLNRGVCGWNNMVHTPILDCVFGRSPSDREPKMEGSQKPVVARFEVVPEATIVGTAIPLWHISSLDYVPKIPFNPSQPRAACSVSVNSSVFQRPDGCSINSDDRAAALSRADLHEVHSRRKSKKVDYVLVMEISCEDPLYQVIKHVTFYDGSVNQTSAPCLWRNPIAVSIAAKPDSGEDPLIRLGIWTAAWHKRMETLRERLFPTTPLSYLAAPTVATPPKLVSLPLIVINNENWDMYFACDSGRSIDIHGPIRIVYYTRNIIDLYVLITCLEYVKEWIETTFDKAMRAWFLEGSK